MATGSVASGPVATDPVATGCSAYDRLNKQLQQSYKSYKKLRQNGELDQLVKNDQLQSGETNPKGMYKTHDILDDEVKPDDYTSDYLRGGVISTVAIFEAFVGNLINEAADLVKKKSDLNTLEAINSRMSKRCNDGKPQDLAPWNVLYHSWATYKCKSTCSCADCIKTNNGMYSKYLLTDKQIKQGITIVDIMLAQGDLEFNHTIRCGGDPPKTSISSIVVSNSDDALKQSKCFICMMLRFCYGNRCVMAHGNSDQTFEKALNDLPNCRTCKADCPEDCFTCTALKDTGKLAEIYNQLFKKLTTEEDKKYAESMVRRIPKKSDFQNLKDKYGINYLPQNKWDECFRICNKYFLEHPDEKSLPVQYAFFYLFRVYNWLDNSRRDMYVTYGLFKRITTFIHTLSFRMYLAVAQLLIDNYGLPDGVWGVERYKIGLKIREFQNNQSVAPRHIFKDGFLWFRLIRELACWSNNVPKTWLLRYLLNVGVVQLVIII